MKKILSLFLLCCSLSFNASQPNYYYALENIPNTAISMKIIREELIRLGFPYEDIDRYIYCILRDLDELKKAAEKMELDND